MKAVGKERVVKEESEDLRDRGGMNEIVIYWKRWEGIVSRAQIEELALVGRPASSERLEERKRVKMILRDFEMKKKGGEGTNNSWPQFSQ